MDLSAELLSAPDKAGASAQKKYRVVGIAMFVVAAGLLAVRMLSYAAGLIVYAGEIENEILVDTVFDLVFSLLVQCAILGVAVFLIYKFALKMRTRDLLAFSNFRKTKWFNYALAVPLGILGLFVTIGVSTLWVMIVSMFGYNRPNPVTPLPVAFNPGLFILTLFLTAVLPGIFEEFAIRGGFFTTMKNSYKGGVFYMIMAIAFGLFHQNILQVFYTALFGAVMAFVVVKTKSIYPCMIIHFFNNATSVYLDYAEAYGWFGGETMNFIFSGLTENFGIIFFVYLLILLTFFGLLALLNRLNASQKPEKKPYDPFASEAAPIASKEPALYKASLRDNAFYIGAIVVTALFTVFSFVWGLFY